MTQDTIDVLNPLTDEQLAGMRDSLNNISDVRKGLMKAKQAGVDTAELERQTDENENSLKKILQVYDPNFRG